MTSDDKVDRGLRTAFDGVVSAIHATKQLVWAAPPEQAERLRPLLAFLAEQSHVVDEAEARRGGRGEAMVSPSGRARRNLLGEVDGDLDAALVIYGTFIEDLADEVGAIAGSLGDGDDMKLLNDLADGLRSHLAAVRVDS